jgi:GAF domain-containing protein
VEQGAWVAAAARRCGARLREARNAAAVAQAVLASVAELGARALLLVVRGDELVSSTGPGLHVPGAEPVPAPGLRIPLAEAPLLREAFETGRCLVAPEGDGVPRQILAGSTPPAADPAVLILPLRVSGKTVSLVYGDFVSAPASPPPLDLLETFAAQAGAALELVLCRKRLEPPPR